MLERISEIQSELVSCTRPTATAFYLPRVRRLIYADNGRGKSTLATVFRSVSTGDPLIINGCQTIDGTLPVKVNLQFGGGHPVTFQNGAWSEKRPELLVFDADFIGRNVHSGGAVNTEHRKNLLDFALGDPAVTARQAVDKATADAKDASEKVSKLTGELSGHHVGMSIDQFEKLPKVDDIDTKVAELQKEGGSRWKHLIAAIQARSQYHPLSLRSPLSDTDGLFEVLGTSLQDITCRGREDRKIAHSETFGKAGAEGCS